MRMRQSIVRTAIYLLLFACGGDKATGPEAITTVTVQPESLNLRVGESRTLTASLVGEKRTAITGRTITWSVTDSRVAQISSVGVVTAVSPGQTTVTATAEGRSGTMVLTVTQVPVASISLEPQTVRMYPSQRAALLATLRDSAGHVLTDRSITWLSSDITVASLSSLGIVTAVSVGQSTITAAVDGHKASSLVTVIQEPIKSVEVSSLWNTLYIGDFTQASATLVGETGATLKNRSINWKSSNPAVATVSGTGLISAVNQGTATITASSEGKESSLNISVLARPGIGSTNVLVDLSHEFSFQYNNFTLWDAYWSNEFKRTSSLAGTASGAVDLSKYDILISAQQSSPVSFGEDELERIQNWVASDGGRLVIIAPRVPRVPILELASRFKITFSPMPATKPFVVEYHSTTKNISEFVSGNGALQVGTVSSSIACDQIISDSSNRSVVIACPWGKGKVVAIAEPSIVVDPYSQEIINVRFVQQLLRWLGPRNRASASIPQRILPELYKSISGGGKIYYTSRTANSTFMEVVEQQYERVDRELQSFTGLQNIYSVSFVSLPCIGGGYSSGPEVGVCSYDSNIGYMTLVLIHELMHSFDSPNSPPEMMHPVVSYVATKIASILGGAIAATGDAEKIDWDLGFKRADPTGTKIDVTDDAVFDRRGKMYWLMGRLDGSYPFSTQGLYNFPMAAREPSTVLRRYFQLKRNDSGYVATPTRIVRLLSIAACRDLFPDFRAIGTKLDTTPPDLAGAIRAACP